MCAARFKYSVLIVVEKNIYKMQHLKGSGTPVLYIGRKFLTLRLLMSYIYIYIYGAPILDVSRSHTTTQHSR